VWDGFAVDGDFSSDLRLVAFLLETKNFADVRVPVGELVGDAKPIGVAAL